MVGLTLQSNFRCKEYIFPLCCLAAKKLNFFFRAANSTFRWPNYLTQGLKINSNYVKKNIVRFNASRTQAFLFPLKHFFNPHQVHMDSHYLKIQTLSILLDWLSKAISGGTNTFFHLAAKKINFFFRAPIPTSRWSNSVSQGLQIILDYIMKYLAQFNDSRAQSFFPLQHFFNPHHVHMGTHYFEIQTLSILLD